MCCGAIWPAFTMPAARVICTTWFSGAAKRRRTPVFDGIPMSWFADLDALRASGRSAAYEATRADEKNFMAPGDVPSVVTVEHEIPL